MLCLSALTLGAPARAGSYSGAHYTGGTYYGQPPGAPPGGPYDPSLWGVYPVTPPTSPGGSFDIGSGSPSQAACSGPITAKFTYTPAPGQTAQSDPPPQKVVVVETCTASAYGYDFPPAAVGGACDDGMGQSLDKLPQIPVAYGDQPPVGTVGSGSVSGTRYTVLSPAADGSVTVTCAPSASATPTPGDSGGNPGNVGAGASVDYAAYAYPVTIDLTGQTEDTDGSFQALTGQQITATFNTHGAPGTVSNYHWSTAGGHPFASWNYTWPIPNYGTQFSNGTQYVPLDFDNYLNNTDGSLSFYEAEDGDAVQTKCTATITFPDSTSASITAQSANVTFQKPKVVNWSIDQPFGNVTMSDPNPYPGTGKTGGVFGATHLSSEIEVNEPPLFTANGATGNCVFCQCVQTDRQWERFTLNPATVFNTLTVLNADGSTSNIASPSALDYGFPYPYGYRRQPDGSYIECNGDYSWAASDLGYSGDMPGQTYELSQQEDDGGNDWYSSTAKDYFNLWLMYRPPSNGQGTIYVPLQVDPWDWGGDAERYDDSGLWLLKNPSYSGGEPHNTIAYPSWTEQITGISGHSEFSH